MNKMSKKLIGILLAMGVSMCATYAYGSVLHEIRTTQTITKGAEHINDRLLMSNGWRNINILKVNLNEGNIKLAPIESATGVERQTLLQLVTDNGAIAGINADYFDMGTSNSPSLGMLINNSTLSQGYNGNYSNLGINRNMATFMITENNLPMMDYFGVSLRINVNGTFLGGAAAKNKVNGSISRPVIIDNTYYQTTSSIVSRHTTAYTLVVEKGTVTYKSKAGEAVNVPSDGFVVVIPQDMANEYYTKVKEGDTLDVQEVLYLNDGITQAIDTMKLGIGGSGLIMKNGVAYTGAAHTVSPNSKVARSVIASVKGTNEILLITIDNSGGYAGVNHEELITLLKRYQVQDAMYLDGGGSTTFVARDTGTLFPTLQNRPSDGSQRKVINGLGIFTTSETGNLETLTLTPSTTNTFVGEKIDLKVTGTDANKNPIIMDSSKMSFSVEGGTGQFNGTTFTPQSAGKLMVIATYEGVNHAIQIEVSEKPMGLYIEPQVVQIGENGSKAVQVYGVDRSGNKILLGADQLSWTSNHNGLSGTGNMITGTSATVGEMTVSYKGVTGQVGVVVGNTVVAVESFENTGAVWEGTSQTVTGSVFAAGEPVYHGQKALKMTYTFKPSSAKQVAYTVFETPITVAEDASSVNLWVNGRNQGHTAKLELVDRNGKKFYLKLADAIDFTGWKYLSANLPEEMALPAKVTKFYVYAQSTASEVTTAVNIDHVSITRGFRQGSHLTSRVDHLLDPYYKESLQQAIGSQYIVNVTGPTRVDSLVLNNEGITQISKRLSEGASLVLKTSARNSQLSLSPLNYTYNNDFQAGTIYNTKFLMVGTGSGGIRSTAESGWSNMKQTLENSSDAKNIIMVMSCNPLTQFTDSLEGQAVHNYLKELKNRTGQNIFVVYAGGNEPEVRLEDGIRYIRINGINVTTDQYQEGTFVKFKMDGNAVYYTLEKFQ